MRTTFNTLGSLFLVGLWMGLSPCLAFDDLTPIIPKKPSVEPIQAKPIGEKEQNTIGEASKKDSNSEKLDLAPKYDLYSERLPNEEDKQPARGSFDPAFSKKEDPSSKPEARPLFEESKSETPPVVMPRNIPDEPKSKSLSQSAPPAELEEKTSIKPAKPLPEPRSLDEVGREAGDLSFDKAADPSWSILVILAFFSGLAFLYVWYQKLIRGKMKAQGIDIQILGQTFLDGQTKIVILKVGPKVIIMAKSSNFCTTLDIITDPEEINLLLLGASAAADGEDFSKVLRQMEGGSEAAKRKIPHEREMKSELEQLKKQLGNLQKGSR